MYVVVGKSIATNGRGGPIDFDPAAGLALYHKD